MPPKYKHKRKKDKNSNQFFNNQNNLEQANTFIALKKSLLDSLNNIPIHFEVTVGPKYSLIGKLIISIQQQCLKDIEIENRPLEEILAQLIIHNNVLDKECQFLKTLPTNEYLNKIPSMFRSLQSHSLLWGYYFKHVPATAEYIAMYAKTNLFQAEIFESIFMYEAAFNSASNVIRLLGPLSNYQEATKASSRLIYLRSARALSYEIKFFNEKGELLTQPIDLMGLIFEAAQAYSYYSHSPQYTVEKTLAALYLSNLYRIRAGELLAEHDDTITIPQPFLNEIASYTQTSYDLMELCYKELVRHPLVINNYSEYVKILSDVTEIANATGIFCETFLTIFINQIDRANFPENMKLAECSLTLNLKDNLEQLFILRKSFIYMISHNFFKIDPSFYLEHHNGQKTFKNNLDNLTELLMKQVLAVKRIEKKSRKQTVLVPEMPLSLETPLNANANTYAYAYEQPYKLDMAISNVLSNLTVIRSLKNELQIKLHHLEKQTETEKEHCYEHAETLANYIIISLMSMSDDVFKLAKIFTLQTISTSANQLETSENSAILEAIKKLKFIVKQEYFDKRFFNAEDLVENINIHISKKQYQEKISFLFLVLAVCSAKEDPAFYAHILYLLAINHQKLGKKFSNKVNLIACFHKKQKDISDHIANMMVAREHYKASFNCITKIMALLEDSDTILKADSNNNRVLIDFIIHQIKNLLATITKEIDALNYQNLYYQEMKEKILEWLKATGKWYIPKIKTGTEINETNLLEHCEHELKINQEFIAKIEEKIHLTDDIKTTYLFKEDETDVSTEELSGKAEELSLKNNSNVFFSDTDSSVPEREEENKDTKYVPD